ncbi:hypothetical protein C8F01DRAFT_1257073 [Mycena amicta]|nr:hypothetical protein C8F01DRAFT_1257073 [Mycena amicta]
MSVVQLCLSLTVHSCDGAGDWGEFLLAWAILDSQSGRVPEEAFTPRFDPKQPFFDVHSSSRLTVQKISTNVRHLGLYVLLLGSLLLNAILALSWAVAVPGRPHRFPEAGYSPAEQAIKHKQLKFHRNLEDDIQIYERRPSPQVDAAWEELYAYAASRVPKSEVEKMTNKTWPVVGEPGNYVIALEVFHQLHCLDMIRQRLHPGGGNYTAISEKHMRHCIGAIRQALMCSADITPIVWQWSTHFKEAIQRDDLVHTCRDFDSIQSWAQQRSMGLLPDLTVYLEG